MTATMPTVETLHRDYLRGYPTEAAGHLERLTPERIAALLGPIGAAEAAPVWELLSPDLGRRALAELELSRQAELITAMDPSRATALLALLDETQRETLLHRVPSPLRHQLLALLSYPADTAGSLMDPKVLRLRRDTRVIEAISRVRQSRRRGVRMLFIVDDEGRLEGSVEMQDLVMASARTALADLMRPAKATVTAMSPREEVVTILERQALTDLPVLDMEGRLIGVVRYRNLMAAAEDEASVAVQTMVGASKDERALSSSWFAVRKRLPWLQINLATAFLAAAVVGLFESTIAQFTALAVLLPVVAGQSGNTGAQALAVTMRGLALREIHTRHWPRVLLKELSAGFWNGLAVAMTTSLGVWWWSGSTRLALVIATAMVLSMVIAAMAGAVIPLLLTALRQDPAQSSSIILTTVTDVAGFLSFLGIATLMLTGL